MRMIVSCFFLIGCTSSHRTGAPEDGGGIARDAAAFAPDSRVADGPDAGLAAADSGAIRVDAGTIAVGADAGAVRTDAGIPPAVEGRIACGTSECDVGREGCLASCLYATDERMPACIELSPEGTWPARDCPTGREMFPRYWLRCDGAEDCPTGETCHMIYGSLGQYAYCQACAEPCDRRFIHELCHGDGDCSPAAPRCTPNADLPGYSTCEPAT